MPRFPGQETGDGPVLERYHEVLSAKVVAWSEPFAERPDSVLLHMAIAGSAHPAIMHLRSTRQIDELIRSLVYMRSTVWGDQKRG